jgi:iron uptake system component EfeO
VLLVVVLAHLAGCEGERAGAASAATRTATPREVATREVKRYVDGEIGALVGAARALCAASSDEARMRAHWREARVRYERVEGAIAILFPQTDADVDGRYEHVAERSTDAEPLDDRGFVGMHAIERVLWAETPRPDVIAFERALPGYVPARPLSSEGDVRSFRDGLCARLVRDLAAMEAALAPVALDPQTAWRGIQGSIEEQAEKVRLGTTGQSESRYAGHTLADMRANLEGGRAVLEAFATEIEALPDGSERLRRLREGFSELEEAYRAIEGDDLPPVPEGFDPDAPSDAHLATPYGRLFARLARDSDPEVAGSLAHTLRETGLAMGIAPLAR